MADVAAQLQCSLSSRGIGLGKIVLQQYFGRASIWGWDLQFTAHICLPLREVFLFLQEDIPGNHILKCTLRRHIIFPCRITTRIFYCTCCVCRHCSKHFTCIYLLHPHSLLKKIPALSQFYIRKKLRGTETWSNLTRVTQLVKGDTRIYLGSWTSKPE